MLLPVTLPDPMDYAQINILILDVDGVLTSGEVIQDGHHSAIRVFSVLDGFAIKVLWRRADGRCAILSGKRSEAVERRAADLGIAHLQQGRPDKIPAYEELLHALDARDEQVCYVGDDLLDIGPMRRCAFPVAVANAAPTVKRYADYVTRRSGGHGAVAEVVELILRKQRRWAAVATATL